MKNIKNIPMETDEQRKAYRDMRNSLQDALAAIENQYTVDLIDGNTPQNTVRCCIEQLGRETVETILTTLVIRSAWDGRISKASAAWALSSETAWDEESANRMSIYTSKIHMAHLEQMVSAYRNM